MLGDKARGRCHGTGRGELCLESQRGDTQLVSPRALAALFRQFTTQVKCVVLNACYSRIQARAIARYVDCVIGMKQAIGDRAAIAFAVGLYQALGAGCRVEMAYKLGCVRIPAMPIANSKLMAITITKDGDHRRSEATASSYHALVIGIRQSFCG